SIFDFCLIASKSSSWPKSTVAVITSIFCLFCKYLTHTDVSNPPEKANTTFLLDIPNANHVIMDLYFLVNRKDIAVKMKTIKSIRDQYLLCITAIILKR